MFRHLSRKIRRLPWPYLGAGFVSAALLVLGFPPYSACGLLFVGMVPFFLAVFLAKSRRQLAWMAVACMSAFILLGLNWVGFVATNYGGLPWIVGKIVLVAFSLFAELQFLLFAFVARKLIEGGGSSRARGAALLVLLPCIYAGMDLMYPKIFPTTLGQALYGWFPVAQLAEYVGVYGLTVPIVAVNLALAILILGVWGRIKKAASVPLPVSPMTAAAVLVLLASGLFAADHWGRRRIAELDELESAYSRSFKVSLLQGNIGDVDKLASERGYEPAVRLVLDTYRRMTQQALARFHPDLIVWPETSWPFLYTNFEDERANRAGTARDQWMSDFVSQIGTPLYFGGYSMLGGKDFNTAFLLVPPPVGTRTAADRPRAEMRGQYRKSILLAFGEYVPLGPLSSFVQSIVPSIADFGRGQGPMAMRVGEVKVGPQICYEGIFPEHSRASAQLGSDILLNITNDSWFGDGSEPGLHLLLTLFRAIELRHPILRGTNTGISAFVDLAGRVRFRTDLFREAALDVTVKVPGPGQSAPVTFYYTHGELFGRFCGGVALMAIFFAVTPWLLGRARKGGLWGSRGGRSRWY